MKKIARVKANIDHIRTNSIVLFKKVFWIDIKNVETIWNRLTQIKKKEKIFNTSIAISDWKKCNAIYFDPKKKIQNIIDAVTNWVNTVTRSIIFTFEYFSSFMNWGINLFILSVIPKSLKPANKVIRLITQ